VIREILNPKDTNITVTIPKEYTNRKIELIIFPIDKKDEFYEEDKNDILKLGGILNSYANQKKRSLEDRAWEADIKERYK